MNDSGTHSIRAPVDDLANRLFFRLYQSANLMHKTGTKALDDMNITTQQWAVIGALAAAVPVGAQQPQGALTTVIDSIDVAATAMPYSPANS